MLKVKIYFKIFSWIYGRYFKIVQTLSDFLLFHKFGYKSSYKNTKFNLPISSSASIEFIILLSDDPLWLLPFKIKHSIKTINSRNKKNSITICNMTIIFHFYITSIISCTGRIIDRIYLVLNIFMVFIWFYDYIFYIIRWCIIWITVNINRLIFFLKIFNCIFIYFVLFVSWLSVITGSVFIIAPAPLFICGAAPFVYAFVDWITDVWTGLVEGRFAWFYKQKKKKLLLTTH